MSALGQKRTYAVQNAMSALPPIATAKADFRKRSCLLYPQKQTCAAHKLMSALGQKRTSHRLAERELMTRLSRYLMAGPSQSGASALAYLRAWSRTDFRLCINSQMVRNYLTCGGVSSS